MEKIIIKTFCKNCGRQIPSTVIRKEDCSGTFYTCVDVSVAHCPCVIPKLPDPEAVNIEAGIDAIAKVIKDRIRELSRKAGA